MQTNHIFILIHSPLAGTLSLSIVAHELHSNDIEAAVPALGNSTAAPYWKQHVEAVRKDIDALPAHSIPIVVAHGGSGVLLPLLHQVVSRPLAGYIFMDADLPEDGKSRLNLFPDAAEAEAFRQSAQGGKVPVMAEADVQAAVIPPLMREMFAAELRPLPLAVYEEALPLPAGWPDAPCGYIQFTDRYAAARQQAEARGWPTVTLKGTHFHPLNQAGQVANALVKIVDEWGKKA